MIFKAQQRPCKTSQHRYLVFSWSRFAHTALRRLPFGPSFNALGSFYGREAGNRMSVLVYTLENSHFEPPQNGGLVQMMEPFSIGWIFRFRMFLFRGVHLVDYSSMLLSFLHFGYFNKYGWLVESEGALPPS